MRDVEGWSSEKAAADFYDPKGTVERFGKLAGRIAFEPRVYPGLHDGQSAAILLDGQEIGRMGAIHPSVRKALWVFLRIPLLPTWQSVVTAGYACLSGYL